MGFRTRTAAVVSADGALSLPVGDGGMTEDAKLVLALVQAIAWPLTVLIIAFGFRKELVTIIGRLKKADLPGGVSLDFAEEVAEARQLSREVEAQPLPKPSLAPKAQLPSIPLTEANARMLSLGLQPSPSGLDLDHYRNLAAQDPNVALAGLRIEIEILARNLAKGFNVPVSSRDSGSRLLRKLLEARAITEDQWKLLQKVLRLCNAAVHGSPVSKEQADSVIGAGEVLVQQYLEWLGWGFSDGWEPAKAEATA